MNASGIKTHNQILDAALVLFAEKGFSNVTMSDFCTACNLSRGGLYRHFNSTDEIFVEMLSRDKDEWTNAFDDGVKCKVSAKKMLHAYLEYDLKGMENKSGRLSLAAYEYVRSNDANVEFATERYNIAVKMMISLLEYGNATGDFSIDNIDTIARHLVIFLDGLRIASVFSVNTSDLHNQINYIYKTITGEDF